MKLAYEPGRVVGGGAALLMAALGLLVYYRVLDVEGAGMWAALLLPLIPIIQAEITRRRTVSVAKIEDAEQHAPELNVENITEAARKTRSRRHAGRSSGA